MELQTGKFPAWDRTPVAFTKKGVVSQCATFITTNILISRTLIITLELFFIDKYSS